MKKVLLSLFMAVAFTVAVGAQDVKKESPEATKKECCEKGKADKKDDCCAGKKDAKDKACCEKKDASAKAKPAGKK
jgi:LAS superfamily LD-carboxypeptidase LdcB